QLPDRATGAPRRRRRGRPGGRVRHARDRIHRWTHDHAEHRARRPIRARGEGQARAEGEAGAQVRCQADPAGGDAPAQACRGAASSRGRPVGPGREGVRTLIRAIVFDLDGVLVDWEIWWDDVRRAFATAHGRDWTADDREAVMGSNSRQWSETMKRRLQLDLTAEQIEEAVVDAMVERYRREGAPAIHGAVEAVRRLAADRPLALASSSHRRVID